MATKRLLRLPLSEVRNGEEGKDFEDLRWYFTEADAAQSGLKSSQSSFEHKMFSGIGQPPARHDLDGRLVMHISRARSIERRLGKLDWMYRMFLSEYFTVVLPVLDCPLVDKKLKIRQARLRKRYEKSISEALEAYGRT